MFLYSFPKTNLNSNLIFQQFLPHSFLPFYLRFHSNNSSLRFHFFTVFPSISYLNIFPFILSPSFFLIICFIRPFLFFFLHPSFNFYSSLQFVGLVFISSLSAPFPLHFCILLQYIISFLHFSLFPFFSAPHSLLLHLSLLLSLLPPLLT